MTKEVEGMGCEAKGGRRVRAPGLQGYGFDVCAGAGAGFAVGWMEGAVVV